MNLGKIIETLNLSVITINDKMAAAVPSGVYCSDLLSCVMTSARTNGLWVTLQAHNNVVAVAAMVDLAAIIITEDAMPDELTIRKAYEEGITLLRTSATSFEICGKLWELGFRA